MTTSIAANKPKAAGRTTATIPNTILNGKGVPLASLGINGDFYIDTRSLLIYGPKTNGKWPIPQNLQGPVGAPGVAGLAGKNGGEGKSVSSASTVTGPTGAQGEKGDKGETGASGGSGAPGSAGGVGPKGDTGSPGAAGGAGTGSPGATGATGAAGAVGAKGETGTAGTIGAPGTVGPSNVYVNTLTPWTLSTASKRTFSTSVTSPKFKNGNSYIYTIVLNCVSDLNLGIFALDILHEDSSVSNFNYSLIQQRGFELDPKMYRYTFTITGTIAPTSGDVGIAIKIIDDMGMTGSLPLIINGRIYSTLLGSIGAL